MKIKKPLLTSAQRKALHDEVYRQVLDLDKKLNMDNDATVLWTMHVCFGFGAERLRKFWDTAFKEHQRLRDVYELGAEDDGWLYREKLKRIGVDIEQWYEEKNIK